MEEWKDICLVPGCEVFTNYEISSTGLVRNKTTGLSRNTNNCINSSGYVVIHLRHNDIHKTISLHRALALLFIENPENYPFVDHKDGSRDNNTLSNLRWCSYSQNNMNSISVGASGYKNISPTYNNGKPVWEISIIVDGKKHRERIKRDTEEVPQHVIECRDKMLKDLHKDFACFRI